MRRAARSELLCIGLAGLLYPLSLPAAEVSLVWDPADNAAGYNVYYGVGSRNYTNIVDAGNATSVGISGLVPGNTYFFAATTYNAAGLESEYSGEAAYTVPPTGVVNRPPTLNVLPNLTINEDAGPQTVTLSGISSGAASETQVLTVSAFSTAPTLVPNPQVTYTSPNATGTLRFTPATGAYGNASITVMVDDGASVSNTVIRSFNVSVLPVNDPPTLDPLNDVVLEEGQGEQMIRLTGISAGADTDPQTLQLNAISSNPGLIPTPAISYSSPSTSAYLSFAPVTNAVGSAVITVTVNDLQPTNNLCSRTFLVRVNQSDSDGTNDQSSRSWTLWWQRNDGLTARWLMDGTNALNQSRLNVGKADVGWRMAGMGDFNGDEETDLVWQHENGRVALWLLDGTNITRQMRLGVQPAAPGWRLGTAVDLNLDGHTDLLWYKTNGPTALWAMDRTNVVSQFRLSTPVAGAGWKIAAAGDFNGDGRPDILWQQPAGWVTVWFMDGTNYLGQARLNAPKADPGWRLAATMRLTGGADSDLLWQYDPTGILGYWRMEQTNRIGVGRLNPGKVDPAWKIAGPK